MPREIFFANHLSMIIGKGRKGGREMIMQGVASKRKNVNHYWTLSEMYEVSVDGTEHG